MTRSPALLVQLCEQYRVYIAPISDTRWHASAFTTVSSTQRSHHTATGTTWTETMNLVLDAVGAPHDPETPRPWTRTHIELSDEDLDLLDRAAEEFGHMTYEHHRTLSIELRAMSDRLSPPPMPR